MSDYLAMEHVNGAANDGEGDSEYDAAENEEGDDAKSLAGEGDNDEESESSPTGNGEEEGDNDGASAPADDECADGEEEDSNGAPKRAPAECEVAIEEKEAAAAPVNHAAESGAGVVPDEAKGVAPPAAFGIEDARPEEKRSEGREVSPGGGATEKRKEWPGKNVDAPRALLALGSRAPLHPGKTPKRSDEQCRFEGCHKYKQRESDGMCRAHFALLHPGGTPKRRCRQCRYKDCDKYSQTHCGGMCRTHFALSQGTFYQGFCWDQIVHTNLDASKLINADEAVAFRILLNEATQANAAAEGNDAHEELREELAPTVSRKDDPRVNPERGYCHYKGCTQYLQGCCDSLCKAHCKLLGLGNESGAATARLHSSVRPRLGQKGNTRGCKRLKGSVGADGTIFDSGEVKLKVRLPLYHPDDKQHLSKLMCLLRRQLEVFVESGADCGDGDCVGKGAGAAAASAGADYYDGRVGIRCVHCAPREGVLDANVPCGAKRGRKRRKNNVDGSDARRLHPSDPGGVPGSLARQRHRRAKGAVTRPNSTRLVYQGVRNWARHHFQACPDIPPEVRAEYRLLSSRTTGFQVAKYWEAACARLGLVDTEKGIRVRRSLVEGTWTEDMGKLAAMEVAKGTRLTLAGGDNAGDCDIA